MYFNVIHFVYDAPYTSFCMSIFLRKYAKTANADQLCTVLVIIWIWNKIYLPKEQKKQLYVPLLLSINTWKYEIILTRVGSTSHRFLLCVLYSDSTHESYKHLNRLVCTMCTIFYLYNLVKSWNIVNAHQICTELVIICIWYKIFLSTEMQKSFGRTVFFLLSQIWRKHNKSPNTG